MAKPPAFSIITVNLNNAPGLTRTRDSVLQQTMAEDAEWIVVDGGSRDDSMSLLPTTANLASILASSEPDLGVYNAMNKGLRRVSGSLVVFLNSGDRFSDPTVLARVYESWQSSGWRWGYGCMRLLDADGVPFAARSFAPFRLDRLALGLATIPHQATFMELSLLTELGGFDETFEVAADQELLLRAALVSRPEVWIDFLADFEGGGIGSQRSASAHFRDMRRVAQKNQVVVYGSRAVDRVASAVAETNAVAMRLQAKVRTKLLTR